MVGREKTEGERGTEREGEKEREERESTAHDIHVVISKYVYM